MARTRQNSSEDIEMVTVLESGGFVATSQDHSTVNIEEPEKELDTPKIIERWWTMDNFVRLTCWVSFWISTYIYLDAIRVAGIRLNPNPTNKSTQAKFAKIFDVSEPEADGNPCFPIMIAVIFFLAMLFNGVVLVTDSKLDLAQSIESSKSSRRKILRKIFLSVMALSLWALSEIFVVIVALIYFDLLYGPLSVSYYFIFLRLFIMIIALFRLWQVNSFQKAVVNSLK